MSDPSGQPSSQPFSSPSSQPLLYPSTLPTNQAALGVSQSQSNQTADRIAIVPTDDNSIHAAV
jgi:hypothetical protein